MNVSSQSICETENFAFERGTKGSCFGYFCVTRIQSYSSKITHGIKYNEVASAMKPASNGSELPIPKVPSTILNTDIVDSEDEREKSDEYKYR